jgi:predicted ferric reductase
MSGVAQDWCARSLAQTLREAAPDAPAMSLEDLLDLHGQGSAAVLLMVLALIKRFPYRWFFKTHHLIAVAYLALVYHSVILLKFDDWTGLLSPVMVVLMGAGSVAAVMVLVVGRGKSWTA